jgi:hypothetical protein
MIFLTKKKTTKNTEKQTHLQKKIYVTFANTYAGGLTKTHSKHILREIGFHCILFYLISKV